MSLQAVLQPNGKSTISAICDCVNESEIKHIDIAVAYITSSGLREFQSSLEGALGSAWAGVEKRWLTSFDYLRTEPAALQTITEMPKSALRIHNSAIVDRAGCVPSVPFHPKVFIVRGLRAERVLAGSGNMSRSGLRRGHEAGIVVGFSKPLDGAEVSCRTVVSAYRSWFDTIWGAGDPSSDALLRAYRKRVQSVENLKSPAVTDDDVLPAHPSQLTGEDLRKLRTCDNFWIEAGNITRNLGPTRPGNQLMMKRLSRVFFGVPAADVPQNSPLTHLHIVHGSHDAWSCSLTFSDNGMDKLTLPAPTTHGPPQYDNENLLFTRIGAGLFTVQLGTAADKRRWRGRSRAVEADFVMSSGGRRWGVF